MIVKLPTIPRHRQKQLLALAKSLVVNHYYIVGTQPCFNRALFCHRSPYHQIEALYFRRRSSPHQQSNQKTYQFIYSQYQLMAKLVKEDQEHHFGQAAAQKQSSASISWPHASKSIEECADQLLNTSLCFEYSLLHLEPHPMLSHQDLTKWPSSSPSRKVWWRWWLNYSS